MNNSAQITAAALIAAATSFATAGSLELDRAYASELKADAGARSVLNQNNLGNIDVMVGVQFGYSWNSRSDDATNTLGDNDTTIGFSFQDVEVALEGDVTDNMHARVSFQFGPDKFDSQGVQGNAILEDAYVDWAVNDGFTLRIGQFIPAYSAEASVSDFNTVNAYRSVAYEFLGDPTWTQGIQATWGGDTWDFSVGFNDGPNTANTPFNSSSEADYAFNARFDLYSDSNKGRFADQSSWRGSDAGWRLGAGVYWASYGNTNPAATTSETDTLWYTVDGAYEGDGWSAWAAFYGTDIDPNAGTSYQNYGVEVGGAMFFSDQWEGFARWNGLFLDNTAGAGQTSNKDNFNFLSVGANYYFVPESQAAKLTLEFGYSFDDTGDITNTAGDTGVTPIGPVTGGNPGSTGFFQDAPGENGQVMVSAIMQWLF